MTESMHSPSSTDILRADLHGAIPFPEAPPPSRSLRRFALTATEAVNLPAPVLRQLRIVAPLLTERVAGVEAEEELAALAAARGPVTAQLLAEVLEVSTSRVRHALARAAKAGLVREQNELHALTHPLVRTAAIALAGPTRMSALHAAFVRLLLDRAGDEVGPTHLELAEHRLAAGESGPEVLQACLQAAEWSWRQGDLEGTTRWAENGLTMVPGERAKARLLHLQGLSALRSRALAASIQALKTAVEIGDRSDDGAAHAAVTLDLLQARSLARVVDGETVRLVRRALHRCPVTETVLRAKLVGHLAESLSWQNPTEHQRLAQTALTLARSSGDSEAVAFALLAGQLAPVPDRSPDQLGDAADGLERLAAVSATARTAARLARGHAALVAGDRPTVEELRRTDLLPRASGSPADDWATAGVAHLQVAAALLDGDRPGFSRAVLHLATLAPQWAEVSSLVWTVLWPELSGLPDTLTCRSPAEGLSPPWFAALRQAVVAVHRATYPVVRVSELAAVAARLPRPVDLARDLAWSTWLTVIARAGALLGDQSQCAESAEALWPYASTFVVLGIGTPIGPAGWFLANALAALGRRDEALAANQEAGKVSARSRSQPWMQRCRTQRARLLRTDKRADVFPPPDAPEPLLPTRADRGEASRQAGPGSHPAGSGQRLASLHTDDLHLLGWVGHGMTNQAIARRLSVSVPTIERRLSSIYRTLGVSNRAQAVSLLAAFTP